MDVSLFKRTASRGRPNVCSVETVIRKSFSGLTTTRRHEDASAEISSPITQMNGTDECAPGIAVEIGVMSELLDLISANRLSEALDLANEILAKRPRVTLPPDQVVPVSPTTCRDRFAIRTGRRIVLVDAAEVAWIAAGGDYATLHTGRGNYLLRETLASLSRQLDPRRFVRVHRSTIVNLDEAFELRSLTNRDALLRMRDGTQLRVSRSYIRDLHDRLNRGCPDR